MSITGAQFVVLHVSSIMINQIFLISFSFRKIYVLSKSTDVESYWMIFDISAQKWTVYQTKINFGYNCCLGKLLTLRGFHYFFHKLAFSLDSLSPINNIMENGTMIDLNLNPPFSEEYQDSDSIGGSFDLVPFYKRYIVNDKIISNNK